MLRRFARQFISVAELFLNLNKILNMHARGICFAAAATFCLIFSLTYVFVEAHAQLRRALKYVEEFAERQPEKREDYGDGMKDSQKIVSVALHPRIAGSQHQSGCADCKQKDKREEIFAELLLRSRSVLKHAPSHRQHHAAYY